MRECGKERGGGGVGEVEGEEGGGKEEGRGKEEEDPEEEEMKRGGYRAEKIPS